MRIGTRLERRGRRTTAHASSSAHPAPPSLVYRYDRYKDIMPRSIAALDSPSFCEILLMALGLDKNDYQLGITKVFFRAGKLAFLDELTGSEYKELAPDIANKVRTLARSG